MRKIFNFLLILQLLPAAGCTRFSPNPPATHAIPTRETTPTVEETDLPFEIIARGDYAGLPISTPGMVVITSQDQIGQFEAKADQEVIDQLETIDYDRFFVIGVFSGLQPSTRRGVLIERVFQHRAQIIVQAQFLVPGPYPAIQVATSPYQLIKVQKPAGAASGSDFLLETREVIATP
jgi:hypothetical protein